MGVGPVKTRVSAKEVAETGTVF